MFLQIKKIKNYFTLIKASLSSSPNATQIDHIFRRHFSRLDPTWPPGEQVHGAQAAGWVHQQEAAAGNIWAPGTHLRGHLLPTLRGENHKQSANRNRVRQDPNLWNVLLRIRLFNASRFVSDSMFYRLYKKSHLLLVAVEKENWFPLTKCHLWRFVKLWLVFFSNQAL